MKLMGFDKVFCLSPHPDDVEFGMMGTILKYSNTQFDILCMSQGGDFDSTTKISRLNEVKDVWEGCKNVKLLFTPNKFIADFKHDAWVNYIETKFLDKKDYNCLFTPTKEDSHFEHSFVNKLTYPLTRVKQISIIEYRTPSTLDSWFPNIFSDITKYFNEKYTRLFKFKSQNHRWYFQKPLLESFHSNFQSYKKGIKYTEKLKIIQLYSI